MFVKDQKNAVWMVVSLILALEIVVSSYILTSGIKEIKGSKNSLSAKVSAKKQITSDLAVWTGSSSLQSSSLSEAYQNLKDSEKKVRAYLVNQGIKEQDIIFPTALY